MKSVLGFLREFSLAAKGNQNESLCSKLNTEEKKI